MELGLDLGLGGSGGWYPDSPDVMLLEDLRTGVCDCEELDLLDVKNVGTCVINK